MASGQSVLVVDGLTETAQVLKAVLEPRGLRVNRIRARQRSAENVADASPSVIVLHEDSPPQASDVTARWGAAPRVIIGSAKLGDQPSGQQREHYLQQPFHYGELISAIEQLLQSPAS